MSGTAELEGLYSIIEETARLMDVTCSRAKVWPVLTAYGDALAQAAFAFRVANGARYAGELDVRFTIQKDVDPYDVALSNGILTATDHPVGTLLSDVNERFPIDTYGIDFAVVGGFTKIYVFFPADDLQSLSKIADTPSMPRSVAENIGVFADRGLGDKVAGIGIDYKHKTVNVYFVWPPTECLDEKTIVSMHREIGLPDPSDLMLTIGQQAFGMYGTLSWESSKIHRTCFPVPTPDPAAVPHGLEPRFEQFVKAVSRDSSDGKFVYAATGTPEAEYYKLASYHQWRPQEFDLPTGWRPDLKKTSDSIADLA